MSFNILRQMLLSCADPNCTDCGIDLLPDHPVGSASLADDKTPEQIREEGRVRTQHAAYRAALDVRKRRAMEAADGTSTDALPRCTLVRPGPPPRPRRLKPPAPAQSNATPSTQPASPPSVSAFEDILTAPAPPFDDESSSSAPTQHDEDPPLTSTL